MLNAEKRPSRACRTPRRGARLEAQPRSPFVASRSKTVSKASVFFETRARAIGPRRYPPSLRRLRVLPSLRRLASARKAPLLALVRNVDPSDVQRCRTRTCNSSYWTSALSIELTLLQKDILLSALRLRHLPSLEPVRGTDADRSLDVRCARRRPRWSSKAVKPWNPRLN